MVVDWSGERRKTRTRCLVVKESERLIALQSTVGMEISFGNSSPSDGPLDHVV